MVTFAVPEHQSVAHFALGVLLDRASLDRISCNGQYQLTVSLVQEDVALLQEMGVVQGDCDRIETVSPETTNQTAICREFERELIELQKRVEAALAKASKPCDELSPAFA